MRLQVTIRLCATIVCTPAMAESPFNGAWVADLDTQTGLSADIYLVADGRYSCSSCTPPRSYPADGKPHQVAGDTDVTSEAVTISGPRSIVTASREDQWRQAQALLSASPPRRVKDVATLMSVSRQAIYRRLNAEREPAMATGGE